MSVCAHAKRSLVLVLPLTLGVLAMTGTASAQNMFEGTLQQTLHERAARELGIRSSAQSDEAARKERVAREIQRVRSEARVRELHEEAIQSLSAGANGLFDASFYRKYAYLFHNNVGYKLFVPVCAAPALVPV